MLVTGGDICLILVTILLPPLAVFFMTGCSADLCINILLTILGYIPGHIHAFWLIYRRIKARSAYGEGGYVYTGNATFAPAAVPAPAGYGAVGTTY
ncbi:hypothetical protein FRC00_006423 [Tulasnella sp. 408]|nr:hypothetical protein FRC00_007085 [Tulasnella sp. 408]KAG8953199.1 hypothetical protein FRC00_006423 [Tulasnella sp. 408]